jgi:hypothetical protein
LGLAHSFVLGKLSEVKGGLSEVEIHPSSGKTSDKKGSANRLI